MCSSEEVKASVTKCASVTTVDPDGQPQLLSSPKALPPKAFNETDLPWNNQCFPGQPGGPWAWLQRQRLQRHNGIKFLSCSSGADFGTSFTRVFGLNTLNGLPWLAIQSLDLEGGWGSLKRDRHVFKTLCWRRHWVRALEYAERRFLPCNYTYDYLENWKCLLSTNPNVLHGAIVWQGDTARYVREKTIFAEGGLVIDN